MLKELNVSRISTLEKIKKNKAEHLELYAEAKVNYEKERDEKTRALQSTLSQEDGFFNHEEISNAIYDYQSLVEPISFEKEYDETITLLEVSQDENLKLSPEEYRCLILNQWAWTRGFLSRNSTYSPKAAATLRAIRDF